MLNPEPDMAPRRLWCVTCVLALTLVLNSVEANANNLGHDTNEGLSNEIFDASLTATTARDANKEVGGSAKEQTKAYQLVPPATSPLLRVIAYHAGLLQQEAKKSLERMTRTTSLLASDAEEGALFLLVEGGAKGGG